MSMFYPVISADYDNTYNCSMFPTTERDIAESEFSAYLEQFTPSRYKLKAKTLFHPHALIACPKCGHTLRITTMTDGDFKEALCSCPNCAKNN